MRDYKLRKKVYNDYATKEELENAGGGGGYQIIDLTDYVFSSTPVTIPGIYEKINNTKKPIVFEGLNISMDGSTVQFKSFFPILVKDGADYATNIGNNIVIVIGSNDYIAIAD